MMLLAYLPVAVTRPKSVPAKSSQLYGAFSALPLSVPSMVAGDATNCANCRLAKNTSRGVAVYDGKTPGFPLGTENIFTSLGWRNGNAKKSYFTRLNRSTARRG